MKNTKNEPRAIRGGSWINVTMFCRASGRASSRYEFTPDDRCDALGFRVGHRKRKP